MTKILTPGRNFRHHSLIDADADEIVALFRHKSGSSFGRFNRGMALDTTPEAPRNSETSNTPLTFPLRSLFPGNNT